MNNGHIICIYSSLLLTVQNSQLNVSTLQFSIICDKVNMHKLTVLLALTFLKEGLPQCLVVWSRSNRSLISVNQIRVLATGYVKLLFLYMICWLLRTSLPLNSKQDKPQSFAVFLIRSHLFVLVQVSIFRLL